MSATPFRPKGSNNYQIRYRKGGRRIQESTNTDNYEKALQILHERLGEIAKNTYIPLDSRSVTVDTLYEAMVNRKRLDNQASLQDAIERWQRLSKTFGGCKAIEVTSEQIDRYCLHCSSKLGLSNATINRDLSALQRAYSLAVENRTIPSGPRFRKLKEAAPRKGFVREPQYTQLMELAQFVWLQAIIAVAYAFGLRRSEILKMRVYQVDFENRIITLDDTKNGETRLAPMTDEVYDLLAAITAGKGQWDHVFTYANGEPVVDFRQRWDALVREAGMPDLLFHDLRRSAVSNMTRRGIPQKVAMQISGHKTTTVFFRYQIIDETDIHEAARKIQEGAKQERERSQGKILAMGGKKKGDK